MLDGPDAKPQSGAHIIDVFTEDALHDGGFASVVQAKHENTHLFVF